MAYQGLGERPRRTGVPLVWQVIPPFVLLTLGILGVATWHAYTTVRDFHQRQVIQELEGRAFLLEDALARRLNEGGPDALAEWTVRLGAGSGSRITVVAEDGRVLADSAVPPESLENHRNRPEIVAALRDGRGASVRHSHSMQGVMINVAVAVPHGEDAAAILRLGLPADVMQAALRGMVRESLLGAVAVALAAILASLVITFRITRPLAQLRQGAERFARGDLSTRLVLPEITELAGLANTMNQMAQELERRMQTIRRQHNELDAVWTSMNEGVAAFDGEERIINLNNAAASLFDLDLARVRGRHIQEVIRQPELQGLVKQLLELRTPVEGELTLLTPEERHIQARGAVLRDAQGESIGGLLVFSDITRLRQLERARKDFVANVTHEIRTPITSIKGYAETLLDGALDNPGDAARFLAVIARQADRLTALIDDILSLAAIEQDKDRRVVQCEDAPVRPVLETALGLCARDAESKQARVRIDCPERLHGVINRALLEQAVVNLLGNAIKYGPPGGEVVLRGRASGDKAIIEVEDQGPGIEAHHLERVFERFYRVDRARSRRAGGTGLGLAIVKHVAELHSGKAGVRSTPGQGSVFSLELPLAPEPPPSS